MAVRPIKRRGDNSDFEHIRRRLTWSIGALVGITLIGVAGFAIIEGDEHGLVDALYMAIITLTTVGFGEVIDMSGNPAARLFTISLLVVGMGIVAYTVPLLAAFFIEGNLLHIFSRRRMEKLIKAMSNHSIVCGDTAATWHVVEELVRTGRQVVVVAPTEEAREQAAKRLEAIPILVGDPSDNDVLTAAGIQRAGGIVASMESDKDNVLIVLTARRFATNVRIIAATEQPGIAEKLKSAGADAIVNPSRIGGLRMASELVRPTVVSFLDRMLRDREKNLRVEEVVVPPGASAAGRTIESLKINEVAGALLIAIKAEDGDFEFKPPESTSVEAGMTLVVMADEAGRSKLQTRLTRSSSLIG